MRNLNITYLVKKAKIIILFVFLGIVVTVSPTQLVSSQTCNSGNPQDRDGDDIPDKWETAGFDANGDGKNDLDLRAKEASPLHKDIFLEIDYMTFHQPYSQVIPDVIEAFRTAPVCNPDGINGIRLHVQLDQEISPEQVSIKLTEDNGTETWKGFYDLKDKYFGTASERLDSNKDGLLLAKKLIYHYAIFAHTFDNEGYSGISNGIPSLDFIVSLGKFRATDPITGHITGTPFEQEGTLMHELGHNLRLRHGGGDDYNCKPNYLSVMSYTRQFPNLISDRPLDYSQSLLLQLDENNLDEERGITLSTPSRARTAYGPPSVIVGSTDVPIDWNRDNDVVDNRINNDINNLNPPIRSCSASPNQILFGYDDWNNLRYDTALHPENIALSREGTEDLNSNNSTSASNSTSMMTNNSLNISSARIDKEPSLDEELTYEDVRNMNIGLIVSIDNAIQKQLSNNNSISALSEERGAVNAEDAKRFYEDKLGTGETPESALFAESVRANDTTVLGNVKSDNLDNAIAGLNDLLPTMDSSFGGALSDDRIDEPNAQQEVAGLITNAIEAFKTQSCTYSNCTVAQKAPDTTIEYG
jgi:hypothetical protein